MSDTVKDCIIVRAPCCKNVVYAVVNESGVLQGEDFKEIGMMVTRGYTVEHVTTEEVRKSKFGCKCK